MYATIRRYTPKTGTLDQKTFDDLKHRIERGSSPWFRTSGAFTATTR